MPKRKLKLERILELANAVETVTANDRLSGKTSYWLGRLGDYCSGPARTFKYGQEKALQKVKPEQDKLLKDLKNLDIAKDRAEIDNLNKQIQDLNVQYTALLKELNEQEEEIEVPEFKLTEFIAAQDIVYAETSKDIDKDGKQITRKIELTIKKGNSLVPIKFFKLMGEYVTE